MQQNNSPWIKQLNRVRKADELEEDIATDVLIIGGGIAGTMTAYFTLKHTDKKVVLIEADKIAHGATGHNAGHVTSYIERSTSEIIKEFGKEMAIDGICQIESSWKLLAEIYTDTGLKTPCHKLTGYGGYTTLDQVLSVLEDNAHRLNGGLKAETIMIAEEAEIEKDIPEVYRELYKISKKESILSLLETDNQDFIACSSAEEACMNSALFCEELIQYIIEKYSGRFTLYENSPIKKVFLKDGSAVSKTLRYSIESSNVILCTNGFENFNIINEVGDNIDSRFHHSVSGRVGYMSGYLEAVDKPPYAVGYFSPDMKYQNDPTGSSYLYITRRPFESESHDSYNLVCGGGPETVLPNHAKYSKDEIYPEHRKSEMNELMQTNYKNYQKVPDENAFYWHGLMGYTPNGIRRIGFEPINKVLLYNLGCNGIGIMPSIYGGKRISQLLNGENLKPSIFDPHDPRK
ncbi:MAG: FAD-binding oxidoreductase [Patescibacteria group bacterium]